MSAPPTLSPLTRLRKARRKKGLCAELRCQKKSGDRFRCEEHAAVYAKRVAEFRVRQRQIIEMEKRGRRARRN